MFKSLIISFSITLGCLHSTAQSLTGLWEGEFIQNNNLQLPIILEFFLNEDSTYRAISYSLGNNKGKDTIVTCVVKVELLKKNNIYLEEVELISPKDYILPGLQKMYLKIIERKKEIELTGRWEDVKDPGSYGYIRFWRRKEKK